MSLYLQRLKMKSNFHFQTCDWMIRFMQWRETTFKDWISNYNGYFTELKKNRVLLENENPNVLTFQSKFNRQTVIANEICDAYKKSRPDRHPCKNPDQILYVSEAFNCDYYFCQITFLESYYDLFHYWEDDITYLEKYLHENWKSVTSKKIELDQDVIGQAIRNKRAILPKLEL